MGETKKTNQAGANPENAKRNYVRPVTRKIVSDRTMRQGLYEGTGKTNVESAIDSREVSLTSKNFEYNYDLTNLDKLEKLLRNAQRINRAAGNMKRKTGVTT